MNPTPALDPAHSTDIAAGVLGGVLTYLVGLIGWVLIGLSLAIVITTVVGSMVIVILCMTYLHPKEKNGSSMSLIGSTDGGDQSNRPGSGMMLHGFAMNHLH